ncbi:MAG: DNA-binding protein Alba [Nanoarchaeota archaeon]
MSEEKEENNIVFIGVKPFMNYVTSVVMLFTSKNKDEIVIKARGRWISRAVEVAEIVRKKFLKEQNIQVKDIKIDSTEIENDEGRKVNVATIEITLKK